MSLKYRLHFHLDHMTHIANEIVLQKTLILLVQTYALSLSKNK